MTDDDKSLGDDATLDGESPEQEVDAQSLGDQSTHGDHSQMDSVGDSSSLGDQLTSAGEGAGEAVNDDMEIVDLESRYTIEGVLGKGGMGEVLLATDTRLERRVAIKRILGKQAGSKTAVNRFLTEAKSVAALNHPNIVQVYDYGRDKQGPFLIMEYVAGESLLERCKHGAIGLEEAIELTVQLCDGLAAAHDAHIIHRDIKPANILLTSNGIPKLTDFGLAKAETADTGMTMAGAVLGTHDFMPPEQRKDAALVDARSDLWSLAATLYQMVTGETPRVIDLDAVPRELRSFLALALKTNKDDRYQTAGEMGTALRECLTVSAHLPVTELGSGECPSCHTRNEASRKFCSECAGPLRAPCFDCDAEIPVWDKVCGECGSNQHERVKQLQEERAKQRAQIEQLLQASEFDKAKQQAAVYRKRHDPRVDANNNWADEMVARIDEKRESELKRIAAIMEEAKSHKAAFDYGAGLRVLKQVPSALMDQSVAGHPQTPQELTDELTQTAREIQRLQKIVQQRLANKEYDGLLEIVEQLQALQPIRPSLNRIQEKLFDREEKLRAKAKEKFEKAKDLFEQQQYDQCSKTLQQVNKKYAPHQFQELNTDVTNKIHLIQQLRDRINTNIESYNHQGETLQNATGSDLVSLLSDVDQFLQLQPDADEILAIRDQLVELENRNGALIAKAEEFRQACQFEQAVAVLQPLGDILAHLNSNELLFDCENLRDSRARALQLMKQAGETSEFDKALTANQQYQQLLAAAGLHDAEFEKLKTAVQNRLYEHQESERATKRQKVLLVRIGIGAAAAILIGMVVATVLWVQSSMGAEDRFKAAMDSFENGTYKDAINKFDDFIERYPSHGRTPNAKVRRVQSILADTYTAKNWDETIKRAQNELPKLEEDEDIDFGPVRDDLAYMLPTSTLNIAKRASKQPTIELMEKELEWARSANAMVNNPVYIPGNTRKSPMVAKLLDDIANTIAACEGLIRKENADALAMKKVADIQQALGEGDWQKALSLDSDNPEALTMKKVADIKQALAKGDYQSALGLDPNNAEALAMKEADIKPEFADVIPEHKRWKIDYELNNISLYAKGLSFFCIDIGVVQQNTNRITLLRDAGGKPQVIAAESSAENKPLYFSHEKRNLQLWDEQIVKANGIDVEGSLTVQFYPMKTRVLLRQIEQAYLTELERTLPQIRRTYFKVVPAAGGFELKLTDMEFRLIGRDD